MRLVHILILILLVQIICLRAEEKGAITADMLKNIEDVIKQDKNIKAAMNAVSFNDIAKLASNRGLEGKIDFHFAHRIKTKGITDQKSSGRCWLFTALNTMRPKVIEKYNLKEFQFSENYLFFWDQLEKANLFLEGIIDTRKKPIDDRLVEWLFSNAIGDGGVWSMMPDLVEKYGLVPSDVMPESYNSENTSLMRRLLKRKLREDGMRLRQLSQNGKNAAALRGKKADMLADIYRILIISLGVPPKNFKWRYENSDGELSSFKEYTPLSFYKDFIAQDINDYVMLMNDPSKDYYKFYEIEYDRNRIDGQNWTFINLPLEDLKLAAKKSILADEAMYFSCDVGKQLNKEKGILAVNQYDYGTLFGVTFDMNKKERILTRESGSSHGMALVGVDTCEGGKTTKWLLENSWGDKSGFEGHLVMTDEWFDEYMFRLVIKKEFLTSKTLAVLKTDAVKLPPWDPMF